MGAVIPQEIGDGKQSSRKAQTVTVMMMSNGRWEYKCICVNRQSTLIQHTVLFG
jgi:hypothetical protein